MIHHASHAKNQFNEKFNIDVELDAEAVRRLSEISVWYSKKPQEITADLMAWADRDA
jgi:hypothetical protein